MNKTIFKENIMNVLSEKYNIDIEWNSLKQREKGYYIRESQISGAYYDYGYSDGNIYPEKIVIKYYKNSWVEIFSTLIHEIGHLKLHKGFDMPTNEEEIEAEMLARMVSKKIFKGSHNSRESNIYINRYKQRYKREFGIKYKQNVIREYIIKNLCCEIIEVFKNNKYIEEIKNFERNLYEKELECFIKENTQIYDKNYKKINLNTLGYCLDTNEEGIVYKTSSKGTISIYVPATNYVRTIKANKFVVKQQLEDGFERFDNISFTEEFSLYMSGVEVEEFTKRADVFHNSRLTGNKELIDIKLKDCEHYTVKISDSIKEMKCRPLTSPTSKEVGFFDTK